jgi:hypothetical protein
MKINKLYIIIAIAFIFAVVGILYYGAGNYQQASIFAIENNPIDGISTVQNDPDVSGGVSLDADGIMPTPLTGSSNN